MDRPSGALLRLARMTGTGQDEVLAVEYVNALEAEVAELRKQVGTMQPIVQAAEALG